MQLPQVGILTMSVRQFVWGRQLVGMASGFVFLAESIESLLARSDRALYNAKTSGSNRTSRFRAEHVLHPNACHLVALLVL